MADAPDLGSGVFRRAGSSPVTRTIDRTASEVYSEAVLSSLSIPCPLRSSPSRSHRSPAPAYQSFPLTQKCGRRGSVSGAPTFYTAVPAASVHFEFCHAFRLNEALATYNRIRNLLAERMERYYLFGSTEKLHPMDAQWYYEWLAMAQQARADYMDRKISSEEFLWRVDSFGVLKNYEAERTEPVAPCDTKWRKRIENDISFDADRSFQTMQSLDLSNGENARWEILTVEEQKLDARGGNESLMDRYESGSSIHNGYCFHFYFIAIAKGRLRATFSVCLLLYFRYKLISGS